MLLEQGIVQWMSKQFNDIGMITGKSFFFLCIIMSETSQNVGIIRHLARINAARENLTQYSKSWLFKRSLT